MIRAGQAEKVHTVTLGQCTLPPFQFSKHSEEVLSRAFGRFEVAVSVESAGGNAVSGAQPGDKPFKADCFYAFFGSWLGFSVYG